MHDTVFKQKLNTLQIELNESDDEKRVFESQYHQIREELEEVSAERDTINGILRKPENELQSELLTKHKQLDTQKNETLNLSQEMEDTMRQMEDLKRSHEEWKRNAMEMNQKTNNEWNVKINTLKQELEC
eukprot:363767_1